MFDAHVSLSVSDYVMHVSEERFLLFSTFFQSDFTFFFCWA